MATPLRAFLMVRSGAGEWTVSVHRDLEDLLKGWEARQDSIHATAVVHVGFDRAPTREFDAVAARFPGVVLLTSAAKFALPRGFHSSTAPVGVVDDLSIFLATVGWGYVADDTAVAEQDSGPGLPDATFSGWLTGFVGANPECEPALRAAGISSDDEYVCNEGRLPHSLRRDLGVFRFRHLIGDEMHDPCAVARCAPPWLAERPFETIDLSVRVANVFINAGIERVGDLQNHSLASLLKTPNFGRKSVDDLLTDLDSALLQGPNTVDRQTSTDDHLLAAVRRSLLACAERERDIISRRMGLNGPPETLQQIGDDYGITRERIRQIESKVLNRLVRSEIWDDILTDKLAKLLKDREFPLPLMGIEAADPWFSGVGHSPEAMRYILENMCSGTAGIVQLDGVDYCAFLGQQQWEGTLSEAKHLLSRGADKNWTEDHCKFVVGGLLPENAREFKSSLWEKASQLCHFSEDAPSSRTLRAYGRGVEQVVDAILREAERPLHFNEIAEAAEARTKREIDIRRAHNAAAAVGILLGRGTYGSIKHIPLDRQQLEELADDAAEVVHEGVPGRQWHSSELLAALVERGSKEALAADKYVVNFALQQSGELKRLGRLVWTGHSDEGDDLSRIDVKQAVISILQQAGQPLRVAEIRQRLVAIRGVGRNFQIVPGDPLIRVGHSIWGLNDRDSAIKRSDQPFLIDNIISALRARGVGIHSSEMQTLVPSTHGIPHEVVFSLAGYDPRLRVGLGQYLYLQEWGGSRRESVPDAVAAVLASAVRPLTVGEIAALVEGRIQRPCDNPTISGCLQALDAAHDSLGRWASALAQDDDIQFAEAD